MTQCEKIIDYMERFGGITTLDAFADLGIMRLASRINDLRKAGYNIAKENIQHTCCSGRVINLTRYSLEETTNG